METFLERWEVMVEKYRSSKMRRPQNDQLEGSDWILKEASSLILNHGFGYVFIWQDE